MKRPTTRKAPLSLSARDIKHDVSTKQLAAIGAITLAFNDLESCIELMLCAGANIQDWLFVEVSSRINGLEGKTAIIKYVIDQVVKNNNDIIELKESVGRFAEFKGYRDAIIHARVLSAALGIGISAERRAAKAEVLLRADALETFYSHILALQKELLSATEFLTSIMARNLLANSDPNIPSAEQEILDRRVRFQETRNSRHLLTPMPKFPTESELREEESQVLEELQARRAGWYRQFQEPPQWYDPLPQRNSSLFGLIAPFFPRPPEEGKE